MRSDRAPVRRRTDAYGQELAQVRHDLATIRGGLVRYVEATVSAVDAVDGTFTVTVLDESGNAVDVAGIIADGTFMPDVGQVVRVALAGAQPIYQGTKLGQNAVHAREIAPATITEAELAFTLGDLGGTTVFYGPDPPVATAIGDLWLEDTETDGADGQPLYLIHRWSGVTWMLLQDQKLAQALLDVIAAQGAADAAQITANDANALAVAAQSTADAAITVFYQTTAPVTGMNTGDMWIDTDDGNKLYSWAPSSWTVRQDAGIGTALSNAATAQGTANAKTTVFYQASSPATTGRTVGDLWVETDQGNRIWTWFGGAWTLTQLAAAALSATARDLGAVTTYRQATAPASGMLVGDLWIDTDDSKLYQYSSVGPAWLTVTDPGIAGALAAGTGAQTTADTKTTTFFQDAAPSTTGRKTGDLWVETDQGNRIYQWNGSWTLTQFAAAALSATARQLGGFTAYYQTTAPVAGMLDGDFWLDTDDGYKLYRYVTNAWTAVQDTAIQTALTNAGTAQATADRKVQIFPQATAPVGGVYEAGDLWIDIDDGNRVYTWATTANRQRINYAINPSFENEPGGSILVPTGWADSHGGTTGTVSFLTVASGATYGTRFAKVVAGGLSTLNTAWVGFQQTIAAVPGDVLNLTAYYSFAVTATNQRVEWMVEWLNAGGTIIGSALTDTTQAALTAGGSRTYTYTTTAAPALTAKARITLRRRGTLGSGGATIVNADLSVDAVMFEKNRPADAPTTYFDGTTGGEAQWTDVRAAPLSASITWQEGSAITAGWQSRQLRTGSFTPASLVASSILATGTITAALFEAIMVLTTVLVAGVAAGDHATFQSDGMHVYRLITGEGMEEVARFGVGVGGGGLLGLVNSTGALVALIDETGATSITSLNVDHDPVFEGTPLTQSLGKIPGGGGEGTPYPGRRNYIGWDPTAVVNTVGGETGLIELSTYCEAGRIYEVIPSVWWTASSTSTYLDMKVRDGGAGIPTSGSPVVDQMFFTTGNNAAWSILAERSRAWRFTTGTHRLLLTVTGGGGGTVNIVNPAGTNAPQLRVNDMGPDYGNPAVMNRGGGGTPVPTQQYYVDLVPAATATFQGNGTQRGDTTDIVQGTDPSGYNGDGSGWWTFNLPTMTGTIDRIDFYAYSVHTYYNGGSWGLLRAVHSGTGWPLNNITTTGFAPAVAWPKVGGVQMTLPSAWYAQFKTGAVNRSIGIGVGTSADGGVGGNLSYYVRFDGPSARLRIWYTQ